MGEMRMRIVTGGRGENNYIEVGRDRTSKMIESVEDMSEEKGKIDGKVEMD